jgi:hypothetical protein
MFDWIKDNKIVTFFQGINSLPGKIISTALWFLFMISKKLKKFCNPFTIALSL